MSPAASMSSPPGKALQAPPLGATRSDRGTARQVLVGLSGVACLAALQALAFPRWPAAAPLAAPAVLASLQQAGLEVTALAPSPGQRSSELARGPRLTFQLRDGATTATLQLLPAQVRQRANFQLALISRDQPSLALPPGLALRSDGGSVAVVEGQLGQQQLRQTCLVSLPEGVAPARGAGGVAFPVGGVSAAQLGAAADQGASGALVTISRILGLTPNRNFGCLLVSLGMEHGGSAQAASPAGMDRLWNKILPALARV